MKVPVNMSMMKQYFEVIKHSFADPLVAPGRRVADIKISSKS
jgi:hypothetical protein